ncbi:MAG: dihydropteroate synthase [Anaerolineae bacterium]|nr:dihydropteroate synthase [Anaerolineae bacterium]
MSKLQLGPTTFEWGTQTYVMGIINVTPDSFSGDGLMRQNKRQWLPQVVEQARRFAEVGAHIVDIGGESTRPGGEPLSLEEELQRVIPAIEAIAAETEIAISIDTYKADVAAAAVQAGAHLVNDVWGLQMDPKMAYVCAKHNVPVVITHNRSRPRDAAQEARLGGRYIGSTYDDLLNDVANELQAGIKLAKSAGIPDEHIIIDPGIGFGKTVEQNLRLLNHLDTLKALGYPLLLGSSNKSFIGYTLDLPADDRVEGTAATVAIGIDRGADIVRVHKVKAMARVAAMTDAILKF